MASRVDMLQLGRDKTRAVVDDLYLTPHDLFSGTGSSHTCLVDTSDDQVLGYMYAL